MSLPSPCQQKYPTTDAYKRDEAYGSSWGSSQPSALHYFSQRPQYQDHARSMQKGDHQNMSKERDQYAGQFLCGGFASAQAAAVKRVAGRLSCPPSEMSPSCQCSKY